MVSYINVKLGNDYTIVALKELNDIAISIYHHQVIVGNARLITDNVDVECITSVTIDNDHINNIFDHKYSLGEIFIKFLIKFPTMVRKPEFRFICNVPDNLKALVQKHHFECQSGVKNDLMVRNQIILPIQNKTTEEVIFKPSVEEDKYPALLLFLQKNAYWQSHLTLERLNLLISNSTCFFVTTKHDELIGFARVLTDNTTFASLWDVVVAEAYRCKGIGTALMLKIFSDNNLCKIPNWILFTDTAKKLYEKFGFVSINEIPKPTIVHKLRIDKHPAYMNDLIKIANNELSIYLNEKQTITFLFESKRAQLLGFWKSVSASNTKPILHPKQLNEASDDCKLSYS